MSELEVIISKDLSKSVPEKEKEELFPIKKTPENDKNDKNIEPPQEIIYPPIDTNKPIQNNSQPQNISQPQSISINNENEELLLNNLPADTIKEAFHFNIPPQNIPQQNPLTDNKPVQFNIQQNIDLSNNTNGVIFSIPQNTKPDQYKTPEKPVFSFSTQTPNSDNNETTSSKKTNKSKHIKKINKKVSLLPTIKEDPSESINSNPQKNIIEKKERKFKVKK